MIDLHGPWSAIRRSPMLRMVSPFVLGLLVAWCFHPSPRLAGLPLLLMTLAALVVLLFPALSFSRWQRGLTLALWFFSFGLFWQVVHLPTNDPAYVGKEEVLDGPWAVRISSINGTSGKVVRADAQLVARAGQQNFREVHGMVMLTLMHDSSRSDPRVGDRLWIDAVLEPMSRVADPGGFDRTAWAAGRGIELEAFVPAESWIVVDHPWQWTDLFTGLRERISSWLNGSGVPFRERALVKALVLGERDELDHEQKDAFLRSGTIHVLSVSGMHVGLIFAVLSFASGWWGKGGRARWIRGIVILLALWGYAGLTGASPSVLRATVMFSLFTLASMARQRTDHLNSLFAAALVLLVWDPAMLQQASFQLSFLAVLGIILLYRPLRALWSPANWWLQQGWALAVVSISAQLLTTPLSLYLFKAFPVWFLPANIVVVTASSFAVYGGVALILFYWVPVVGPALTWAMTCLLRFVGWSTDYFATLPGAYPAVRVGFREMMLLYVLVLAITAWWQWKWKSMKWLSGITLAALFLSWGFRARDAQERSAFVVYDERDGFLAGMVNGRELVVAASADSSIADPGTVTKLDRHQRAMGLSRVLPVGEDVFGRALLQQGSTVLAEGRWKSPEFDVFFSTGDAPRPLPGGGRFDAVVLHDLRFIAPEMLEGIAVTTHRIVLAGGLPWRARNAVREWCATHQLACHDVREQGAFILER